MNKGNSKGAKPNTEAKAHVDQQDAAPAEQQAGTQEATEATEGTAEEGEPPFVRDGEPFPTETAAEEKTERPEPAAQSVGFSIENAQEFIKARRCEIDTLINSVNTLSKSREISLVHTNLQRAKMFLGKVLGQLGRNNPYPESKDPKSAAIEPQADHSNDVLDWTELATHVAKVKDFRAKAGDTVFDLKETADNILYLGQTVWIGQYYITAVLALEEAAMWGGWELDRIRQAQF